MPQKPRPPNGLAEPLSSTGNPSKIAWIRAPRRDPPSGLAGPPARRYCPAALREPHLEMRRGARVVDRGGLENRCTCKGTVGSNPTLSAIKLSDAVRRRLDIRKLRLRDSDSCRIIRVEASTIVRHNPAILCG